MKSNDLLTIGDLARRTGLSVSAIRFYEGKGLVEALRTGGNQRRVLRSDIRRLSFILIAQRLGLTLAQAATMTGITEPSLSRIETGRQDPADATKFVIANAFGCGVGDLWPWPDMERVLAVAGEHAA